MPTEDKTIRFNIAYHPTPYPDAMRRDLEDIAEVCDGIYLPFAESDLEYRSNMVKRCIDIAHEMNLIVVADFWGYGNLFACGGIPSQFACKHQELGCVSSLGRTVLKSCPNKPAVRAFMKETIEQFLDKYGADGVFWDEPGWGIPRHAGALEEGEWLCRCPDCLARFEERFGHEMPMDLTEEIKTFRNETTLSFLSDLCAFTKACGDHLITSTCVMPINDDAFKQAVGQAADLDILGIDPYWSPAEDLAQEPFIAQHAGFAGEIARENGKLLEVWLKAYDQHAGREKDAYRAAKFAALNDADCISAWSYRDCISFVQCDQPNQADADLVWKNLRRAYHEIREGDFELNV